MEETRPVMHLCRTAVVMVQGTKAWFSGPEDVPDGPPITLRLQRGGVFAADVVMDAALLRPLHPRLPAAEVRLCFTYATESAGATIVKFG